VLSAGQMHAAVLHGTGQVPRYELFPGPVAGEGTAVIAVTAAALKPSDRLMADGVGYVPESFPQVAGLDGVGRLADGRRVGFFLPQRPYGGMAQRVLVRQGTWLPVRDDADEVMAAALLNPGMAAWKSVVAEGKVEAGQSVLVLGATGTSGRISAQLAAGLGARVVAAGRNQRVLEELRARGAQAVIRLDRGHDELIASIAKAGPYDLVIDYLWGSPAEAVFSALTRLGRAGGGPERVRYLLVGMSAGAKASLPAMTLRAAPVILVGSGTEGQATLAEAAAGFDGLLRQAASGEISVDVATVPLADVEKAWSQPDSGRRVVFVP
jgi:NADPH:quinone reductase-like Zn-dependent oxidoreductase